MKHVSLFTGVWFGPHQQCCPLVDQLVEHLPSTYAWCCGFESHGFESHLRQSLFHPYCLGCVWCVVCIPLLMYTYMHKPTLRHKHRNWVVDIFVRLNLCCMLLTIRAKVTDFTYRYIIISYILTSLFFKYSMSLSRSSELIISKSLTGLTSPSTWVTSSSSNAPGKISNQCVYVYIHTLSNSYYCNNVQ